MTKVLSSIRNYFMRLSIYARCKNFYQGFPNTAHYYMPSDIYDGLGEGLDVFWDSDPSERPPFYEIPSVKRLLRIYTVDELRPFLRQFRAQELR